MLRSSERRSLPRLVSEALAVTLRARGTLAQLVTTPLDFNRHGVAVLTHKPLAMDQQVFVTIAHRDVRIDQIVGVVHNCRSYGDDGYRCGIRFRTQSPDQLDKELVEAILIRLERDLLTRAPGRDEPAAATGS